MFVGGVHSSKASLLDLEMPSSQFSHGLPSVPICVFFFIRIQVTLDSDPSIWPHFILVISVKALSPNPATF